MARKRFQRGTVFLRGTRNPVWVGRWREDEITSDGLVRRVCQKQVLGYKRDLPTKKLALRELESKLTQINSPNYRPLRNVTFKEFSEKWLLEIHSQKKPSTQSSTRSQLRRHLCFFSTWLLRDIQLSVLRSFVASLKCSPKTTRNLVMTLRSIWRAAKEEEYVSHDPFEKLQLPLLDTPEQRFFTADEMARIIEAAPEPYKTFYWLAAETGMRAGELCALRWEDVDYDKCIVQVRGSVWRGNLGTTKSRRGVRDVAVSSLLVRQLLGMQNAQQRTHGSGLSYVFSSSRGTPWDANLVVKRKLGPLLHSLGIPHGGLHAFRHGNETIMDRASTPQAVRLTRMGHSDTRMMRNYSHAVSADDRAASSVIADKVAPVCAHNEKGLTEATPITLSIQ